MGEEVSPSIDEWRKHYLELENNYYGVLLERDKLRTILYQLCADISHAKEKSLDTDKEIWQKK